MKKLQVKGNGKARKEIAKKMSPEMDSESASSEPEGEESEQDAEESLDEPTNGFTFDHVGHPEAPESHLFPTPPPDARPSTAARKTSVISKILNAIEVLDSKTGSSVQAIAKYIKSNGHEVTDERRFGRQVLRSLKACVTNGQVVQIKRSFKLVKNTPKRRKSMEQMKSHQAQEKAKEKAKEKELKKEAKKEGKKEAKMQAKQEAKEAKAAEKAKEKAAKQPSKKKKLTEEKPSPKVAAAAHVTADMTAPITPKMDASAEASSSPSSETAKTKSNTDSKARTKQKKPRKSIGTLAQPMVKSKIKVKDVKQLVAGKGMDMNEFGDDVEAESDMPEAQATSTPQLKGKATRKRK
ncbi:histone H1-II-like [Drosophila subobscura]|uniref:histone H1-II-like n=1 Tax=Drosophila subobscura TaxID=7241 RepID=UPI00155AFD8B|nr:histone H1-II-like [Drosophila subobscura]